MKNLREKVVELSTTRIIVATERNETLLDGNFINKPFATLEEIELEVKRFYGHKIMIYVWYELGLTGHIFQYGNHGDYWELHGRTKGYA